MDYVQEDIEALMKQLLPILVAWHGTDVLGEIAIVRGGQDWQLEERPIRRHRAIRRMIRRESYLDKVTETDNNGG